MRVFMLGWEFPPLISGGLGTACYGLTRGLDDAGVEVCFVLPTAERPYQPYAETTVEFQSPGEVHVEVELAEGSEIAEQVQAASPAPTPQQNRARAQFEHTEFHRLDAVLHPYGAPGEMTLYEASMLNGSLRELIDSQDSPPQTDSGSPIGPVDFGAPTPSVTQTAPTPPPAPEAVPAALGRDVPLAEPTPSDITFPGGSVVKGTSGKHYDGDLLTQVFRFATLAVELALTEPFDVIHAHDWMTFPAAIAVAHATGKPLVVHVHSTEFDRSGEHVNQAVYDIERAGIHAAARIVCVSHLTRNVVVHRYGGDPAKIEVVYNAVELTQHDEASFKPIRRNEKIVLFLGRITMQKGPEYFLQAAKRVIEIVDNVRFVIAGSGDMIAGCIELAADLGIGRHVTFTGFLRGNDVERIFQMADLYVMPSVSEPFGIAPLEAMSHNVPVLISKQSGVSEVLTHVLKCDFWDVDDMANKILAVLRYPSLQKALTEHTAFELQKLSWDDSAKQLAEIYRDVLTEGA